MLSKILLFFLIFILFVIFSNFSERIETNDEMTKQIKYILLGLVFAIFIMGISYKEGFQVYTNIPPKSGDVMEFVADANQALHNINYNNYDKRGYIFGLNYAPTPFLTPEEQSFVTSSCPDMYKGCDAFLTTPLSDNETFCTCNGCKKN